MKLNYKLLKNNNGTKLIAGALEKMDKFLSLETAWKSRYQEESDLDDMHVPESAELFITLLLTMTG